MKVLVVLALAVAVVSAGFTGSLNQQVQPHLQQAIQQIRADLALKAPARNSAEAAFQAKFLDALQEQITNHVANLQSAYNQAQIVIQAAAQAAHTTAQQLQQLGTQTAGSAQDIMAGFMSTIMGLLNPNGRALPPQVAAIVELVVGSQTFLTAVHTSATYLCLKNHGYDVTYQMVQEINSDKPNGWNNFLAEEGVQECIRQGGGLTNMIQQSSLVQSIAAMVKPMGLTDQVHALVNGAVGEPWASQIIAGLSSRGLFSNIGNLASGAWDHVSGAVAGAASSAWGSVTNGASNFADYVSSLVSQTVASAADKFEIIKEIAAQFLMQGVQGLAQMAADKAFEVMAAMAPFAASLGNTWTEAVELYESVHGLLNLGK